MTTQAQADAQTALDWWWRKDVNGRPLLPVDPAQIARNLGVDVYVSDLDHDVSGVLVKQNGGTPTIYVNAGQAFNRQRFTCAHEVGHYWRRRTAVDNFGYVDKRDPEASKGRDPEEMYANGFAAELLMPAELVRDYARQGWKPEQLAQTFAVSLEAMRIRFSTLGLSA